MKIGLIPQSKEGLEKINKAFGTKHTDCNALYIENNGKIEKQHLEDKAMLYDCGYRFIEV